MRCGINRHLIVAAGARWDRLSAAGLPDAKAAAGCAYSKESKGVEVEVEFVAVRIGGRWKGVGGVGKVGWELRWGGVV